ncbi:MAG TPA: MoaD/ThiS family protein [Syntrophomonadaceae bacterium]|nr:MoaD/ThiS family protein [Syntrophomonadaceae bacterium]
MDITVKLFATLRQGRFKEEHQQHDEGTKVKDIVEKLSIPQQELGIIFINGKHAKLEDILHDSDALAIFPPVGGG